MTKREFLTRLSERLSGLTPEERSDRVRFYSEMVDDRMEEGLSEEEAVASVGSIEEILVDIPCEEQREARPKIRKGLSAGTVVLLLLGAPLWLPLLIAGAAVVFSLYAALWALILSVWAVCLSLGLSGLLAVVAGAVFALGINGIAGLAAIGAGLFCAGVSVFVFFAALAATRGAWRLSVKCVSGIVNSVKRRRGKNG